MSYETFKSKVRKVIAKAGNDIHVRFTSDEGKRKFFALCSDGTVIIGSPNSLKVTVRFG